MLARVTTYDIIIVTFVSGLSCWWSPMPTIHPLVRLNLFDIQLSSARLLVDS